jgi:hypothetical protein
MSLAPGTVSQLVNAIRTQLAVSKPVALNNTVTKSIHSSKPTKANRYAKENLSTLIESRIKSVDRADPERGRKAFRAFLEAILLSEFGEELVNDPKFHQLTEDIQVTLETDVENKTLIDNAIRHLMSQD